MRLLLFITITATLACAEDAGRIMRPTEGAVLAPGDVDIIATAPAGRLELDGKSIAAQQPFPNVWHAITKAAPGAHTLTLLWDGGRKDLHFSIGGNPTFHTHPPVAGVQCTQCHEVNKRGRFRFKGGCFDCHQQTSFTKIHTHDASRLEQCGLCHNAHGSSVKAHLLYPKETACKICHN
jgi:predicted CXXCH cytochrome family protein